MSFAEQTGETSVPQWTSSQPTQAPSGDVRLCLYRNARLVVIDDSYTELAVLFRGISADITGTITAYVQVRGCSCLTCTPPPNTAHCKVTD
jgi:hypothetical protein